MKILIGYDGSNSADAAIEDLRRAGLPREAEARVICVADHAVAHTDSKSSADSTWISRLSEAELLAEGARKRIHAYFPEWAISGEALSGSPAKIILHTAEWWHPDLIVVGSHGRSAAARLFLGSVSVALVHNAPCSVRVARSGETPAGDRPIRIVIGSDGSKESEQVVRTVAARSWPPKTEVRVVSAVQTLVPISTVLEVSTFQSEPAFSVIQQADEDERMRLHDVAEQSATTLRQAGLIPAFSVVDGVPGEVILAETDSCNADAIFVGARGLGRLDRVLLGSVSTHVVTHAHCAVEVVRQRA